MSKIKVGLFSCHVFCIGEVHFFSGQLTGHFIHVLFVPSGIMLVEQNLAA